MSAQGGESAVDLFGQHCTGQLVGKGHGREGQKQVSTGLPEGWKAVVTSNQKDDIAGQALAFGDKFDEAGGIPGLTSGIEKDFLSRSMASEDIVAVWVDFAHSDGSPAAGAFQEFFGDGIGMFIAGFSDVEKIQSHGRYY